MQRVVNCGMVPQAQRCMVPGIYVLHSDGLLTPSPTQFALVLVSANLPLSAYYKIKEKMKNSS